VLKFECASVKQCEMANNANDTFDRCVICTGPYIQDDPWMSHCYITAGFDPKHQRPINYHKDVSCNQFFHRKCILKNLWVTEGKCLEDYENPALDIYFKATGREYLTVEEICQVFNDLEQTEPLELAVLSNCALCPKCRTPYRYVHFYDGRINPNKTVYDEEKELPRKKERKKKYPEVKEKVPPKRPIEVIAQEAGIPQHLVRYAPNLRIAHPYRTRQTKIIEGSGLGTIRAAYYSVSYPSSSSSLEPTGKKGKKIPLKPPSKSSSSSEESLFSAAVRQPDGTHLSTLDAKLKQQQEYRDFNLERLFSGMEPNSDAVEEDEIDVELTQNEPEDLSMPRDDDEDAAVDNAEAQAGPSTGRVYDKTKFDDEGKNVYECRVLLELL
jgi:predicted transcriptional regulator